MNWGFSDGYRSGECTTQSAACAPTLFTVLIIHTNLKPDKNISREGTCVSNASRFVKSRLYGNLYFPFGVNSGTEIQKVLLILPVTSFAFFSQSKTEHFLARIFYR